MDNGEPALSTTHKRSMLSFTLSRFESSNIGPRLGQLLRDGRKAIKTPHYIATTSRGAIPHISHDVLAKHTAISSMYLGFEDFIEKQISHAPILKTPIKENESRLRKYIAAQDDVLNILGPRRVPPVPCPAHNTGSAISICTSVGFAQLSAEEYHNAVLKLNPDITITMADVIMTESASVKRMEKSADRTHAWLRDSGELLRERQKSTNLPAVFAAIPPLDNVQQSLYLQDLAEEYRDLLSGLAIYSSSTVADLPPRLCDLPRIYLSEPSSPQALLNDVALGIDLFTVPFIASSSDHGIALTFRFPCPDHKNDAPQAMGVDLWTSGHETDLSPLSPDCDCFTCTCHHKAYIHHLLQAKEMLAWTLLQLHNHATVDQFFEACRTSIAQGTFEEDVKTFNRSYEVEMPAKTGQGPRIRGYQMKSVGGGEARKNAKSWGRLDDATQKIAEAGSGIATPEGGSGQLEQQGFAEKA